MLLDLRMPSRNSFADWPRSSARGRTSCLTNHWCASKHPAQRIFSHSKHQKSADSLQRLQTAFTSTICLYTDRRRCRLSKKTLSSTIESAPKGPGSWQIGHCKLDASRHPEHSVCRQDSSLGRLASTWHAWQRRNWNSSSRACWGTREVGVSLKSRSPHPPDRLLRLEAGSGTPYSIPGSHWMIQNPGFPGPHSPTYSVLPALTPQWTEHLLPIRHSTGPGIHGWINPCLPGTPCRKEIL